MLWWLCSMGMAGAQGTPSTATPAPAAIVLGAGERVISLDSRSRFWIDDTGKRPVEQVEAAALADTLPWQLRVPGSSYNLDGNKAMWIVFDTVLPTRKRWFIELQSSGLDRAQLFYRGADGQWVEQEAGDVKAVSDWPVPGRFPTFELSSAGTEPVRHFLRVEHARVDFATPVALYDQAALVASREREQFLLGAYFGLALLITLVAAANAIAYRDRNFAVYAVYVGSLAIGQLAYLGVGAQHIWNEMLKWNEVATFVLPGISGAAALWFARTVTEPGRFSKVLDMFVWLLILALLAAVALDTWLLTRTSFAVVMVLAVLSLVTVAGLIAMVWIKGDDPYIRLIALGFVPVVVMALFPVARGLNLMPASGLTRYALAIGAAVEMPILFYALTLRGNRRRESRVRAAALSHNDALTGIAHQRTLLQRLDDAIARARTLKRPCALLAARISNFDAIIEEFGRETGERMLVVAASHLRHAITDIDLAARVGSHDFALLLEGPTTAEIAMSRAQQLVASGLRPNDALPPAATLKFHITVAMLPDGERDAPGSLQWLVDGLDSMRPDARKLIRPLNF